MTKEKLVSLTKYLQDLTNRLTSSLPSKHKNRPESYKRFLNNEIKTVKSQLETAKLDAQK